MVDDSGEKKIWNGFAIGGIVRSGIDALILHVTSSRRVSIYCRKRIRLWNVSQSSSIFLGVNKRFFPQAGRQHPKLAEDREMHASANEQLFYLYAGTP